MTNSEDRLIIYDELALLYGFRLSRKRLRELVALGRFPPPVSISENRIAWWKSALDAHFAALQLKSYAPPAA